MAENSQQELEPVRILVGTFSKECKLPEQEGEIIPLTFPTQKEEMKTRLSILGNEDRLILEVTVSSPLLLVNALASKINLFTEELNISLPNNVENGFRLDSTSKPKECEKIDETILYQVWMQIEKLTKREFDHV